MSAHSRPPPGITANSNADVPNEVSAFAPAAMNPRILFPAPFCLLRSVNPIVGLAY